MKNQRGITLISVVILLAIIVFFGSLAIRVVPMYLEYYTVVDVMDEMQVKLENDKLNKAQVHSMLMKYFDVAYIHNVKQEHIEIIRGRNTPYITKIVIDYEVRKPFIAHIDLIGHFKKEIDVEPKR